MVRTWGSAFSWSVDTSYSSGRESSYYQRASQLVFSNHLKMSHTLPSAALSPEDRVVSVFYGFYVVSSQPATLPRPLSPSFIP